MSVPCFQLSSINHEWNSKLTWHLQGDKAWHFILTYMAYIFQVIMIQISGNRKKKQMVKSETIKCTIKPDLTVSTVGKETGRIKASGRTKKYY